MESILKYTGLAGLALALTFFLLRDVIRKNLFPRLTKIQGYELLRFIIWIAFSLSVICILVYFLLSHNILNPKNKNGITDTIARNNYSQNSKIEGDNNIVVNGTGNNIIKGGTEYVNDGLDSTFLDFIRKNEGRTIYINSSFSATSETPWGAEKDKEQIEKEKEGFYESSFININYTFSSGDKDKENIVAGDLTNLDLDIIWPIKLGSTLLSESDLYTSNYGKEHLTIVVDEKHEGSLRYNRGTFYITGDFRAFYHIGGQGYNFIKLVSA